MRTEYKIVVYVLAVFITILLSILLGERYVVPIPAPLPFGFGIIAFLAIFDCLFEVWRGKSPNIQCNEGHWSINPGKDIKHIPWQADLVGKKDKKNVALGTMTIMFTGGIDYWGISMASSSEYPVLIFPSIFEEKVEKNYRCYANLHPVSYAELSPYIRHVLSYYKYRIKKNTPVFFGCTSHLDGSSTPENLALEFEKLSDNENYNALKERNKDLYEELRRKDERKQRHLIIGREVKAEGETYD